MLGAGGLWLNHDNGGAEVVGEASHPGWRTIRYQGVRVDIPASWERLDTNDCEFQFEVWAPSDSASCEWSRGMAFYGSATFDAAHKPGVRRTRSSDEPGWSGHTYAGDFALYVSDGDRQTVVRVLRSAR